MTGAAWSNTQITHRDGVPWHEAPLPRRWHRCRVQTKAWLGFDHIERCACGAIRYEGRAWLRRNERRAS